MMKKEHKGTSPPFNEWHEWQYEIKEGHFYTSEEELIKVRGWFMSKQKRPLVMLKDEWKIKSLLYDLHPDQDSLKSLAIVQLGADPWARPAGSNS